MKKKNQKINYRTVLKAVQWWATQLMSGAIDWRTQITWGRQYNSTKMFKYKCNIHFQYLKGIGRLKKGDLPLINFTDSKRLFSIPGVVQRGDGGRYAPTSKGEKIA